MRVDRLPYYTVRDLLLDLDDWQALHPYWFCAVVAGVGFVLGWVFA